MDQSIQKDHLRLLAEGKKIAFIQAGWHSQIVRQAYEAFVEDCSQSGIAASQIDVFDCHDFELDFLFDDVILKAV